MYSQSSTRTVGINDDSISRYENVPFDQHQALCGSFYLVNTPLDVVYSTSIGDTRPSRYRQVTKQMPGTPKLAPYHVNVIATSTKSGNDITRCIRRSLTSQRLPVLHEHYQSPLTG